MAFLAHAPARPRLQRTLLRLLAVFVLLHSAVLLVFVRPQHLVAANVEYFKSSATLYLFPPTRQHFASSFGLDMDAEVNQWLASPALFDELVTRRHVVQRAAERLNSSAPTSAEELTWFSLVEAFDEDGPPPTASLFPIERKLLAIELRKRRSVLRGRVTLIRVSALGNSPREAQQRVSALTEALREVIGEVSSEENTRSRVELERQLKAVSGQAAKIDAQLKLLEPEVEPDELVRKVDQLLEARRELTSEIAEAGSLSPMLTQTDQQGKSLTHAMDALRVQVAGASRIYQPGNAELQRLQAKLSLLQSVAREEEQEKNRSQLKAQSGKVRSLENSLREVDTEIKTLRSGLQQEQRLKEYQRLTRFATSLDSAMSNLNKQVFLARLDEKIAQSDAALLILSSASLGQPYQKLGGMVMNRSRLLWILIPFSLFGALTLLLIYQYLFAPRPPFAKIEELLDTRVVAILPKRQR